MAYTEKPMSFAARKSSSWVGQLAAVVPGILALGATGGCSFHGERDLNGGVGRPAIPGLTALRVEPRTATIVLDPANPPPSQQFRAVGTVNGQDMDVTGLVAWTTDRPNVAVVDGGGWATAVRTGGIVDIGVSNNHISAAAVLTVVYTTSVNAEGPNATPPFPADVPGKFNGPADASRNPELVYPNDGVLFPPNVFGIEVHWRPGSSANMMYEIRFQSAIGDIKVYSRCQPLGNGCLYLPSRDIWTAVAETNRGTGSVQLTVRGTDDNGSAVGSSAPFSMSFSKDDLIGALYYWTTSQGTAIMRWDFANTNLTMPERFITPTVTGGVCVGCHALSRDGNKIAASSGGQNRGNLLLFDVMRSRPAVPFPLPQRSQFESWNPDGTRFVGVYGDQQGTGAINFNLFDGTTGLVVGQIDLGGLRGDHPDWSEDGNRIAFTSVDTAGTYTDQRPGIGGISYIDGVNGAWGAPQTLVPAQNGKNHYYPAIAPDNQTLVYNESTCPSGTYGRDCNADTDPSAKMWVTLLPPAPVNPSQLGLANSPGVTDNGQTNLTNSFPKWAPFVFHLSEERTLLWLTVSSTRQYGLRPPPPTTGDQSSTGTLIWMIGVDPNNLFTNQDPSYAAFCLPFQDITTSNHIAQWTQQIPPPVP
jgi:hypothetical protein